MEAKKTLQTFDLNDFFDSRIDARATFAQKHGWDNAQISALAEDCAFRRYYRVIKANGETALILDSFKEMEDQVAPRHRLSDVVRLSKILHKEGITVPQIYAADLENSLALLEDFGNYTYTEWLTEHPEEEVTLYHRAVEMLMLLREKKLHEKITGLDSYWDVHVHANRVHLVQWYLPVETGENYTQAQIESYLAAWEEVENALPPCPMSFTHCDFHLANLMHVEKYEGIHSCGLIDFQGALLGPSCYDLCNLLEDARKTLPEKLKIDLYNKYCEDMSAEDKEIFDCWYVVMAAQFHCRVIGLFIRLYVRDNKDMHLEHIPRLQNYLKMAMDKPFMQPLTKWFKEQGLTFDKQIEKDALLALRGILS